MKVKKIVFAVVVFLFLFGVFSASLHAEPAIPVPTAPQVTTTPQMGLPPVPVSKNDSLPGQNQQPPKNNPIPTPPGIQQPPAIPQVETPGDPNQPPFDPNALPPGTPPITPASPAEAPIKNYSTNWYTTPWFIMTMVILLVIVLLVIYSLKEGKAPSEEKEETTVSKKKKNNKK